MSLQYVFSIFLHILEIHIFGEIETNFLIKSAKCYSEMLLQIQTDFFSSNFSMRVTVDLPTNHFLGIKKQQQLNKYFSEFCFQNTRFLFVICRLYKLFYFFSYSCFALFRIYWNLFTQLHLGKIYKIYLQILEIFILISFSSADLMQLHGDSVVRRPRRL